MESTAFCPPEDFYDMDVHGLVLRYIKVPLDPHPLAPNESGALWQKTVQKKGGTVQSTTKMRHRDIVPK